MKLSEFHTTVMSRPHRYHILDKITRNWEETDIQPRLDELQTYRPTERPDAFRRGETKACYIDLRYEAKLRLYNYLKKKCGVPEPERWADPETGKSKPILNF